MTNTFRFFLLVLACCGVFQITAQGGEWCLTGKRLQQKLQSNPALAQQFLDYNNQLRQQAQSSFSSRDVQEEIYIPVVFHIIHNGDPVGSGENITDAQCISQIDALNRDYNFQDPDIVTAVPSVYQALVANCRVKFCLAQFDQNGNPTSGINRYQFTNVSWDTDNDIDNTLKPATEWDNTKYLNIWSVRMGGTGTGTLVGDGVLAYSSIPFPSVMNGDGIVARYTNIGTTSNVPQQYRKGKTITHEVGHWLSLLHVWGFDSGCGDFGDFIDDTPDQADLNFGCPSFPHITCNNGPNGDMFMNYMDYTNESCQAMFTIDQAARMQTTLNGVRASIKNAASQCFYNLDAAVIQVVLPSDTVCSLSFKPVVTIKNTGTIAVTSGKFYFQFDGGSSQIVNWNGNIGSQQQVSVTLPVQTTTTGNHTFDITFGNVNNLPTDNFSGNNSLTVSFTAYEGGSSSSIPFAEDFEGIFPPADWSVYNPNGDLIKWAQNLTLGAYGLSLNCVSINNRAYTSNPNLKKDAFITGSYDLSSVTYPELKFDVAYAKYNTTRADSLNIYYSLDCGSNWLKIWNQRGDELATAPDQTTAFIPVPSQWKTVSVPLTSIGAQSKVSFKFENVSGWGNAMYIDNINVQNNPALSVNEIEKQEVKVFPNPAGKFAGVRFLQNHPFTSIKVFNSIGELVYQAVVNSDAVIFSVESFASGLYLLYLEGDGITQTDKLLISK